MHCRCQRIVLLDAARDLSKHKYLEHESMKGKAALPGRVRSFGPVTSRRTVAKYLSEEEGETMSPYLPV